MRVDHTDGWISVEASEVLNTSYDLSTYISSGEVLASAVVTAEDYFGNSVTASIISNTATSGNSVTFTISNGVADKTYSIKIKGYLDNSEVYINYITCEVYGGITLNSILGDRGANTYVTLEEADNYIRNKYGHVSTWDNLTIEGKKRVLIQATRDINTYSFVGEKYYDSQPLEFPRDEHDIVTGNCATPVSLSGFTNSNLYSTTYGVYPTNYWKYGACHITEATPLYDTRIINTSDATDGAITIIPNFTATPTTNTEFIIFAPLDEKIKNAQCEQVLFVLENSNIGDLYSYKSFGTKRVKIGDTEIEMEVSNTKNIPVSTVAMKLLSKWIQKTYLVGRA